MALRVVHLVARVEVSLAPVVHLVVVILAVSLVETRMVPARKSTKNFSLSKFWILACQWHLRRSYNHLTSPIKSNDCFLFILQW
jgi:hypothetical protein